MRIFDHDFPDNLPDEWCTALRKLEAERVFVRVNGCLFVEHLDRPDHPWHRDGLLDRPQIKLKPSGRGTTLGRLICAAVHGLDIDDRSWVGRHKCDNSGCIQPTHLEPGTVQDDADDRKISEPRVDDAAPHQSAFFEPDVVARRLGVSRRTLMRMIERGTAPPHIRLSQRTVRFSKKAFEEWLQRGNR